MATTRDEIERHISTAKSDSFAALSRAISLPGDSPERVEAERRVKDAQQRTASLYRRLAEEFGAEVVVPLGLGIAPSPSISGATLLQDEYDAVLLFNSARAAEGDPASVIMVRFERTIATRFGLPNDEGLGAHPLSKAGLEAYSCGEVLNSSWRADAAARNRQLFPANRFSCRHFIFTFHDSTFECLAGAVYTDPPVTRREALGQALAVLSHGNRG